MSHNRVTWCIFRTMLEPTADARAPFLQVTNQEVTPGLLNSTIPSLEKNQEEKIFPMHLAVWPIKQKHTVTQKQTEQQQERTTKRQAKQGQEQSQNTLAEEINAQTAPSSSVELV